MTTVAEAIEELKVKSIHDINRETAAVWGNRALAAYQLYRQTRDPKWMHDAQEYAHEALEHASLTGDGSLVSRIWEEFQRYNGS